MNDRTNAADPFAPLPESGDPFSGTDRPSQPLDFWKPATEGEYVIGLLDRVEQSTKRDARGGRFPDNAVMFVGVVFTPEGQPVHAGRPLRVPINSNMQDRITADDAGCYIRVTYTGALNTGKGNPVRLFDVAVIPHNDTSRARAADQMIGSALNYLDS